eukprot:gene12050-biopygen13986
MHHTIGRLPAWPALAKSRRASVDRPRVGVAGGTAGAERSVNGKISPRRVGGIKRTASAKVPAVSRRFPAACERFESADRFFVFYSKVPRNSHLRAAKRAAARARSWRVNDMDEIRE